jgi:DNA-binding XRE family transcriptional regulator
LVSTPPSSGDELDHAFDRPSLLNRIRCLRTGRRAAVKAKDIGATVKALRAKLGMTTTTLAAKVGISQAQISRLENGQQGFRSETLVKIAKALKAPPFRLLMTDKEWAKWKRAR